MIQECGVVVDDSSINRWAIRFLPWLAIACRTHQHAVGTSWRMDETYIKVNGGCKYLDRAVDKQGQTVDLLLTAKRDAAAKRFFEKAIRYNTCPTR
jgi:putative transposase